MALHQQFQLRCGGSHEHCPLEGHAKGSECEPSTWGTISLPLPGDMWPEAGHLDSSTKSREVALSECAQGWHWQLYQKSKHRVQRSFEAPCILRLEREHVCGLKVLTAFLYFLRCWRIMCVFTSRPIFLA